MKKNHTIVCRKFYEKKVTLQYFEDFMKKKVKLQYVEKVFMKKKSQYSMSKM